MLWHIFHLLSNFSQLFLSQKLSLSSSDSSAQCIILSTNKISAWILLRYICFLSESMSWVDYMRISFKDCTGWAQCKILNARYTKVFVRLANSLLRLKPNTSWIPNTNQTPTKYQLPNTKWIPSTKYELTTQVKLGVVSTQTITDYWLQRGAAEMSWLHRDLDNMQCPVELDSPHYALSSPWML